MHATRKVWEYAVPARYREGGGAHVGRARRRGAALTLRELAADGPQTAPPGRANDIC
jgi:hypothetical protein